MRPRLSFKFSIPSHIRYSICWTKVQDFSFFFSFLFDQRYYFFLPESIREYGKSRKSLIFIPSWMFSEFKNSRDIIRDLFPTFLIGTFSLRIPIEPLLECCRLIRITFPLDELHFVHSRTTITESYRGYFSRTKSVFTIHNRSNHAHCILLL